MSELRLQSICRLALCESAPEGEWQAAAIAFFRVCRTQKRNPLDQTKPTEKAKPSGPTMPFGKYKGKTVDWIVQTDPNYAEWVLDKLSSQRLKTLFEDALEDYYNG